jgi:hypothetical protein
MFVWCGSCSAIKDVQATMIYMQVLNRGGRGILRPLDLF